MFRKGIVVLVVLLFVAATGIAFAWVTQTCQQSIEGTWDAEIWNGEITGEQCWDQCDLTVASDGSILAVGSYADCGGQNYAITGGQLTISAGCVIEGVIETDGGPVDVANGGIIEDKMYFGLAQPTSPPEEG
jgi:hypothetical protein